MSEQNTTEQTTEPTVPSTGLDAIVEAEYQKEQEANGQETTSVASDQEPTSTSTTEKASGEWFDDNTESKSDGGSKTDDGWFSTSDGETGDSDRSSGDNAYANLNVPDKFKSKDNNGNLITDLEAVNKALNHRDQLEKERTGQKTKIPPIEQVDKILVKNNVLNEGELLDQRVYDYAAAYGLSQDAVLDLVEMGTELVNEHLNNAGSDYDVNAQEDFEKEVRFLQSDSGWGKDFDKNTQLILNWANRQPSNVVKDLKTRPLDRSRYGMQLLLRLATENQTDTGGGTQGETTTQTSAPGGNPAQLEAEFYKLEEQSYDHFPDSAEHKRIKERQAAIERTLNDKGLFLS